MTTIEELEDENKNLRWILGILLKQVGGKATVTVMEMASVDSDDVLEIEQSADKCSWTFRLMPTITIEPGESE
jgi:hypothetical protein